MTRIILISMFALALASPAAAEICRSVSATWQAAESVNRTVVWTTATDGCKDIEHQNGSSYEDIYAYTPGIASPGITAIRGIDCNCDLVADGHEANIAPPPLRDRANLMAICAGPVAEKPEMTRP